MPTEKPLPDPDEDIIDLTDLVEEEKKAGGDAPVDMSFEQELDDLFGDVEPDPVKPAAKAKKKPPADEDDALDLTGLDMDDAPSGKSGTGAPGKNAKAADEDDDDALDLAGFGLDDDDADGTFAKDADDDALDLTGLGLDDDADAHETAGADDDDALDLGGLGLDDEASGKDDDDALDLGGLGLDDEASGKDDDDALDLGGLGLDDEPGDHAPGAMADEDDGLDLAGFDIDEAPGKKSGKKADGDSLDFDDLDLDDADAGAHGIAGAGDDDALDLGGLGLDDEADALKDTADTEDDSLDLDGLGFDDEHAEAAPGHEEAMEDPFGDAQEAASLQTAGDEDLLFPDEDDETPGTDADAAPSKADDALDLSDMPLDAFEPKPEPAKKAGKKAPPEPAMDDLLGDLPDAPQPDAAKAPAMDELSALPSLEETPAPAAPAPAAVAGAAVAGAATLAAVAATATATASNAIDLASLDKLIDTAKPAPEPADQGRLDALAQRLDALEHTSTALGDKLDSLPPAVDGETLATAMSATLEKTLAQRLEAIMAGQPKLPDTETLKAQIVKDAVEQAASQQTTLVTEMRESLARLESLNENRQTQFKEFATSVETQLTELRNELPRSGSCATNETLTSSMEALGETLSRQIAGKLDERMTELRRELRESLGADLAAGLDERMTEIVESARQAARQEVQGLGEALSGRIEALEADHLNPETVTERVTAVLTDRVRDALAPSLEQLEVKLDRSELDSSLASMRERLEATMGKEDFDAAVSALRARLEAKIGKDDLEAALATSLEPLEEKVDRQDLEDALDSLRDELTEEIKSAIPKVAATIIREEISSLAKEMQ